MDDQPLEPKPNLPHKIALGLEKGRFTDLAEVSLPTRQVFINGFLAGLARGFGLVIGTTLVAALVLYLLGVLAGVLPDGPGHYLKGSVRTVQDKVAR